MDAEKVIGKVILGFAKIMQNIQSAWADGALKCESSVFASADALTGISGEN